MTIQQFKETIQNRHKSDDRLNYLYCSVLFAIGGYFMFIIFRDLSSFKEDLGKILVLILPLSFLLPGIYALWRIPKEYDVILLESLKNTEDKLTIINKFLLIHQVIRKQQSNEILTVTYKNKYSNMVDLNIYFDEQKMLLNVQGVDQSGHKGFIDFGLTKRAKRNFVEFMKSNL